MIYHLNKSLSLTLLAALLASSCASDKKKDSPAAANAGTTESQKGKTFVATGQLAIGAFGLTAENPVTHVIAFNAETGVNKIAEVKADGSFELALNTKPKTADDFKKADGTIDREAIVDAGIASAEDLSNLSDEQITQGLAENAAESDAAAGSPWIVTYINKNKTGADMIVSRFGSETLDTVAPSADSTQTLDFGTVTPVAGARATSTATYENVLTATELSAEAAQTLGAIDTVSLRNSNPDINNNGVLDATEHKTFTLDFHNRFVWRNDTSNAQFPQTSFKNKFADEVAGGLNKLRVSYQGTGIIPELEKSEFATVPSSYVWSFAFADAAAPAVQVGQSAACTENVTTLASGAECTQSFTENANYDRHQMGLEVALPPEGTYTLKAGGQTFTWTNVEVSDFSAGDGFLALMVSYTVGDNGTPNDATDDRLTGFKHKYMKKDATAGWVPATQEELDLIVKKGSSGVSLKFQGSTMQCFWRPDRTPTGEVVFASTDVDNACQQNPDAPIVASIKAGTLLWSKFSDAGVSYDDKLGMRFFF